MIRLLPQTVARGRAGIARQRAFEPARDGTDTPGEYAGNDLFERGARVFCFQEGPTIQRELIDLLPCPIAPTQTRSK